MNRSEIKKIMIDSLMPDADQKQASVRLEEAGVTYDFKEDFNNKVLDKLFATGIKMTREVEFVKSMNLVFYRVALTGAAAIVIMLISIFLMEGSLSLNSLLGVTDSYDESIVCLLTGI
jgi:hypothetical protein